MDNNSIRAAVVSVVAVALGAGLAVAGSQGGLSAGSFGLFAIAVAVSFVIQWVAFVPSFLARSERFFDITGSLTFIGITVVIAVLSGADARGWLLAFMVVAWALRLGSFLFTRVDRSGGDDRFDELKTSFFSFGQVWTIQGLWVSMTAAAAWIAITTETRLPLDGFAVVGALLWLAGLSIETVADLQKSRFKAAAANTGKFINTGLWSRSRHPNYFGEIVVWIGVAVVTLPVLQGWAWIALGSPLFVALLLTKVSGIPLLEAKAERRWGEQSDYHSYRATTPVLIPRLRLPAMPR
jgi:steroid 5-alpha reductase family enzyme